MCQTEASLPNHKIVLLGFTVPKAINDYICRVDRYMSTQTFKFAWNIVSALEKNGLTIDLISTDPVSAYPYNPHCLFVWRKWRRGNKSNNLLMPFINIKGLKHMTRFLSALYLLMQWAIRNRGHKNKTILIHGVHTPFLYAALVVKMLFDIAVVPIITDPPGVLLPGEGKFIKQLRKIDISLVKKSIQKMSALIVLTQALADYLAPRLPTLVVEGMVNTLTHNRLDTKHGRLHQAQRNFTILYAGGLKEEYGLALLVDAMTLIHDPTIQLWIYGKGEYADIVKAHAKKDTRIKFFGYVPSEQVAEKYHEADLLVNPRPTAYQFTKYSFPSKIMEYMASGTPVLTTKLSGIPDDYYPFLFTIDEESESFLATKIMEIKNENRAVLLDKGARAKNFVEELKCDRVQGERIIDFFKAVC